LDPVVCDVGMPFGHPQISIPGPTIMEVDRYKDSTKARSARNIDLEYKTKTLYSTRKLVNPSLVAYIKPDRGTHWDINKIIID
jgi:hypothetical protein